MSKLSGFFESFELTEDEKMEELSKNITEKEAKLKVMEDEDKKEQEKSISNTKENEEKSFNNKRLTIKKNQNEDKQTTIEKPKNDNSSKPIIEEKVANKIESNINDNQPNETLISDISAFIQGNVEKTKRDGDLHYGNGNTSKKEITEIEEKTIQEIRHNTSNPNKKSGLKLKINSEKREEQIVESQKQEDEVQKLRKNLKIRKNKQKEEKVETEKINFEKETRKDKIEENKSKSTVQTNKTHRQKAEDKIKNETPRDHRTKINDLYAEKNKERRNQLKEELQRDLDKAQEEQKEILESRERERQFIHALFIESETPAKYEEKWIEIYERAKISDKKTMTNAKVKNGKFRLNEKGEMEILPDHETYGKTSEQLLHEQWRIK